ncbi:MAG: hypothetical protein VW405_13660 [Rhodospirillaceae bacterium]
MPTNIKLGLSVLTLTVGAAVHFWEADQGNADLAWIVAGLTVFMVLAMWVFPETGGKADKDG